MVNDWLYQRVAGIEPAAPGYTKIKIQPYPVGDLTNAAAHVECPLGQVSLTWTRKDGGDFMLRVVVPVGATAEILVPHATATPSPHLATPRSRACATATPPSRSAPAPTCSTPPCDDDKTQRSRTNASTSTRGRPAVPFTRTVTACVPVALHERTKTILAGCTVLAYRSTVPASTPSTYTVALPRLGPRTATQPTDRALAVNLAQASACVEPRT